MPGEAPTPWQRALVAADAGHGVAVPAPLAEYTFINADLSVHLVRPLRGEWVGLESRSVAEPSGIGLCRTRLWDADGVAGRAPRAWSSPPAGEGRAPGRRVAAAAGQDHPTLRHRRAQAESRAGSGWGSGRAASWVPAAPAGRQDGGDPSNRGRTVARSSVWVAP